MAILAIVGASATGKDTIAKNIMNNNSLNFRKITSYTSRKKRDGEKIGADYFFVDNDYFQVNKDMFAEIDEYEGGRLYGTLKDSYKGNENKLVILTPNGVRQLKRNLPNEKIFVVYLRTPLHIRCQRYINRCSYHFTESDLSELHNRVERDSGMFKGFENEADLIVNNIDINCTTECILKSFVRFLKDNTKCDTENKKPESDNRARLSKEDVENLATFLFDCLLP